MFKITYWESNKDEVFTNFMEAYIDVILKYMGLHIILEGIHNYTV